MPARREPHTGRHNLLHRSWGPLEPFDDSMPELLRRHGVYTHLVSEHQHYWEDGGGTYHHRYSTWVNVRGQEGDRWRAHVGEVTPINDDLRAQELHTMLFDLERDPGQERPIDDPEVEARMVAHLVRLTRESDAPKEQFERLGLEG